MSANLEEYDRIVDLLGETGVIPAVAEEFLDKITTAAVITELRKLLELKDTAVEWETLDWYVRVDDIEERIAELEATL